MSPLKLYPLLLIIHVVQLLVQVVYLTCEIFVSLGIPCELLVKLDVLLLRLLDSGRSVEMLMLIVLLLLVMQKFLVLIVLSLVLEIF